MHEIAIGGDCLLQANLTLRKWANTSMMELMSDFLVLQGNLFFNYSSQPHFIQRSQEDSDLES